jgi:DNA-binding NarL/FixJ family response regulator
MKGSGRPPPPQQALVVSPVAETCCGPAPATSDALPGRARIVLIDDDWIALSRLREIIEQNSDLEVVAACRCAEGAMLAVRHCRPAIVILDVRLPDRDGFELVRDITAISEAKVIVFTAALERAEIVNGLRSGAKAIVFKDKSASMLISRMRDVLAREECAAQKLTARERPGALVSHCVEALSERELEVAQWAALGARNKEIAWQLGISEGTVKLHLFHAYQKLSVSNRVGLVLALRKVAGDALTGITFVSLTFV